MSFRILQRRPRRARRLGRPPTLAAAAVAATVALASACGPGPAEGTMSRDTFIEAYVALRAAALDTDSAKIATSDRVAILERLGVTEEDLLDFADVHGEDVEYMRDVWDEVELRMDQAPSPADPEG